MPLDAPSVSRLTATTAAMIAMTMPTDGSKARPSTPSARST
jgi:hypothetical protein